MQKGPRRGTPQPGAKTGLVRYHGKRRVASTTSTIHRPSRHSSGTKALTVRHSSIWKSGLYSRSPNFRCLAECKMRNKDRPLPALLTTWKEIADYFGKSLRTMQRWERETGLPIHRPDPKRRILFAVPDELDVWLRRQRETEAEPVQLSADLLAARSLLSEQMNATSEQLAHLLTEAGLTYLFNASQAGKDTTRRRRNESNAQRVYERAAHILNRLPRPGADLQAKFDRLQAALEALKA